MTTKISRSSLAPTTNIITSFLRNYPGMSDTWNKQQKSIAQDILADVAQLLPDYCAVVDSSADMEDFWEDACRISAAYRACLAHGRDYILHTELAKASMGERLDTASCAEFNNRHRLGPILINEQLYGTHNLDPYINNLIVNKYAGRNRKLCSVYDEFLEDVTDNAAALEAPDAADYIFSRYMQHGITKFIIKTAAMKTALVVVDLHKLDAINTGSITAYISEILGWTYVNLVGRDKCLLVQDYVTMTYETRFFCVDGEIITGAGCIEQFTPLDKTAPDTAFDDRLIKHRLVSHNSDLDLPLQQPQSEPEIFARLLKFAQHVAADYDGTATIDVCLNTSDDSATSNNTTTPIVVEFNEINNSGLYASNPWLLAEALITARDRGYRE